VDVCKKGDLPGSPKAESSGSAGSSGNEGTEASAANTEDAKDLTNGEGSGAAVAGPASGAVIAANGQTANAHPVGEQHATDESSSDPWVASTTDPVPASKGQEENSPAKESVGDASETSESVSSPTGIEPAEGRQGTKVVFLSTASPKPRIEEVVLEESSSDEDDDVMEDQNLLQIMQSMVSEFGARKPPRKFDSLSAAVEETQHSLKSMKAAVNAMIHVLDPSPYVVEEEDKKEGKEKEKEGESPPVGVAEKNQDSCDCKIWRMVMAGYKAEAKQFKKQLKVQRETYKLLRRLLKELQKIVQRRQRAAELSANIKRH